MDSKKYIKLKKNFQKKIEGILLWIEKFYK